MKYRFRIENGENGWVGSVITPVSAQPRFFVGQTFAEVAASLQRFMDEQETREDVATQDSAAEGE